MKKALILISFILAAVASFSFNGMVGKLPTNTVDTFINKQTVSSASTLYKVLGGFRPDTALILPFQFFADTTAANFSKAAGYNGSLLLIGTDVWYRTLNPAKWNKLNNSAATLVSISQGVGLINSPNPITTTGTISADTLLLSTKLNVQKVKDSLVGMILLKLNISDTANMLVPYLRKGDTSSMLLNYVRNSRLINTNAPLYGGGSLASDLTLTADTGRSTGQLSTGGSLNKVKDSLVALISSSGGGTVLSVATTDGVGIISSVANPTSSPNISIRVDTLTIATKAWRQKGDDSLGGIISLKLNISDTSSMLSNYLRKTDTSNMLSTYLRTSDTSYMLSNRLKISDTATMLAPFVQYSDTAYMLSNRLKISDTATMLSGYTRVQRFLDTTSTLRSLINTKGTGTVTSVGLSLPAFLTVNGSPVTTSGTLTATLANQSANRIFAGPTTGSVAQPTFRSLVEADLPDSYLPISDTANMLSNLLRISDTTTMLQPFVKLRGDSMYGSLKIHGTANVLSLSKDNNLPTISFIGATVSSVLEGGDDLSLYTNGVKNFYVSINGGVFVRNSVTTGTSGIIIGDGSSNAGAPISFLGASTTRNWQIATQLQISDGIAFTPSTTIGGNDFIGAPVLQMSGSTRTASFSDSLFANDLKITGTGFFEQITTTGFDNYEYNINSSIPPLGKITRKYVDSLISIGGTVTNVSGTWALSFINSTTTPIGSIDTLWGGVLTKKQGYNALDSGLYLKLNISDTLSMLSGYVPYKNANKTVDLNSQLIKAGTAEFSPSGTAVTINSTAGDALLLTKTAGNPTVSFGSPTTTYSLFEAQNGGGLKIYTGNGTQSVALSINQIQEITATSSVTASSFIKSGGTSSQSLMADGSVLTVSSSNTSSAIVQRDGSGNFAANVITGSKFIGNSAADNGIDAIQSGGGSGLFNLIRTEGKVQASSATIDATATVWNDNTNGSTVTYTLPSTSSLQGGLFMFVKTGTGNLTLSGTIVKSDGSSVGSMTLASTDGLNQFWFNGTTWYQVK